MGQKKSILTILSLPRIMPPNVLLSSEQKVSIMPARSGGELSDKVITSV